MSGNSGENVCKLGKAIENLFKRCNVPQGLREDFGRCAEMFYCRDVLDFDENGELRFTGNYLKSFFSSVNYGGDDTDMYNESEYNKLLNDDHYWHIRGYLSEKVKQNLGQDIFTTGEDENISNVCDYIDDIWKVIGMKFVHSERPREEE